MNYLKRGVIDINIGQAVRYMILELCKEHNTTTVSTVKKICDGLGITVLEFFDTDVFINLEQEIN